jgi:hypothetical protein
MDKMKMPNYQNLLTHAQGASLQVSSKKSHVKCITWPIVRETILFEIELE